ncbi:hypothetical protein TcCL_Unassigned02842 [Trypanosoma cruzi]|nr:hypothetical protein TcCL_Unassigned02842 [Trypanosoma cruzi]
MRTANTRPQREGRGTSKCIPQSFTSPFPGGLASHTHSEARRTPPAPSEFTQQAGAQSLSCHRKGEHKQSSPRTISASSRKEEKQKERGHVNCTVSRGTLNGTRRNTVTADTVTTETSRRDLKKKEKKKRGGSPG